MAALKWDALTDAATACAYLDIAVPTAGSRDEVMLYGLINGVSRSIRRWCERQFTPERGPGGVYSPAALSTDPLVVSRVRTFDYDGEALVKMRPYEPRSVSALSIYASGTLVTPQGLTPDVDYVLMPRDLTDDGTYLWVAIRDVGNASIGSIMSGDFSGAMPRRGFPSWPGGYAVAITGAWGMMIPPDDVVEACWITIAEEWANPQGFQSRAAGEITASEVVPPTRAPAVASPFPQRAELMLEPYRRGPEI